MSVVMGGTRRVVYSVISRRLEHPSVMDQVEYLYLHRVLSENVTGLLLFFSTGFCSLVVFFPYRRKGMAGLISFNRHENFEHILRIAVARRIEEELNDLHFSLRD